MKNFSELNLDDKIILGLEKQGITVPTEIQSLTIPEILNNKDVIGEAHTGSGKTLAFLTPLFQKIDASKKDLQALILAPTRELVMQIEKQAKLLSENSNMQVNSISIIGDVNMDKQIKKLKEIKPQIVVGTPGRVLDLIRKKKIKAHTIKTIVLDEGDNLLDNTHLRTIKDIIKSTMRDRQLLIFSATVSAKAMPIAKELMKDPIIFKNEKKASLNPNIEHMYIEVEERDKAEVLRKLIAAVNPSKAIVFINRGFDVEMIADKLKYHNQNAFAMHKRITKEQRQQALENFRNGKINILVSSDISARGLDIDGISHIINLDFPANANEYLHRAGRTARGNAHGTTISLVTKREFPALRIYEREFNIKIEKKTLSYGELV
ncbi:DEAD/DEAH box helicase [Eubacterium multiforme]|uniref:Superfamily II DNA/RNA helicase n=1 Tax=Eubacterium multiforme TaxID=83339 RepID=A0ABT9UPB2_9FIRM|nr:DEAD/DEAH box helicase [Eubacterium multiforme]MDQ0148482.1 superfamily II DNA/RNA helicase [Eubacterium multiforme]